MNNDPTAMEFGPELTGDFSNDWARRNQRARDAKAARAEDRKRDRIAAERESDLAWRSEARLRFMEGWG